MSRQENSTSNNSHVVQNSKTNLDSAPYIVTTEQIFISKQPNYALDSYELPARYKR